MSIVPGCVHEVLLRADAENLVGEAKREGLDAILSAKYKIEAKCSFRRFAPKFRY
jgi:hypothetical protein